ncbi:MAG: tRNA uridine-5-carboxymethylaminomethyl(34) synthesis GTPase MnmE [Spirochaetaceae bacterium]|jgi:tRNA modification GTPase|nr:tRNA uridine-5-carboxymethylaminomethyl(34) synthesis GTPase MnmE [Spirochaetaceae bacterium]
MAHTAYYGDEAPVAALATDGSRGALDIIRVSGKGSLELFAPCFSRGEKLLTAPGNVLLHGWIRDSGGALLDEVMLSVFRSPRSYTGEDALDISCHGGGRAARSILERLRELGFRDALRGEFTFRAFMHGKLDLTRCEAVMELVSSKTELSLKKAAGRLSGLLYTEIKEIKDLLIEVLTGAELLLDYSEEDGVAPPSGTGGTEDVLPGRKAAGAAVLRLAALAASYARERLCQEGALLVIAGRPNAGKSSLFNYLLGEERSSVTETPGTTRDWIEAWVSIGGIPVRLADTAGFQDSQDRIERQGIERSRALVARSGLTLYLVDGSRGMEEADREFIRELKGMAHNGEAVRNEIAPNGGAAPAVLVVWNKIDKAKLPDAMKAEMTGISAKTGEGMAELEKAIIAALVPESDCGDLTRPAPGIAAERQKLLVDRSLASLKEALALADAGGPLDLVAPLLRDSVDALGEISGEVSTADILDAMFSRFCVGK